MTRIDRAALLAAALLAAAGPASGSDRPELDASFRLWAAPEGSRPNRDSPFAPAADRAGIGAERGRGEATLRLRRGGLTAELAARSIAQRGRPLATEGGVNELFYEADLLGQHFTLGKRVASWDVGFGYRPLDLVQQEDRRAFRPFALEGIPLLAWELAGESSALTLVYANPLRGQAPSPRDDESAAARVYQRLGALDLYLMGRTSRRTRLQAGCAAALVLGDALELHGSFRWQRRLERLTVPQQSGTSPPLYTSSPIGTAAVPDTVAGLLGFTLAPGWDLSILGEAWIDPAGGTAREWKALGSLAESQRALLSDPALPSQAVTGNLAWGLAAFDRPNLVRESLLLHMSQKWERLEPAVDLLYTPADGGWVATASASYQGEPVRMEGGLRLYGGRARSAYRLFPESAIFYVALQSSF